MYLLNELFIIVYLTVLQFRQIFPYWILGVFAGSLLSVFAAAKITKGVAAMNDGRFGLVRIALAAVLGAASPICMYGTVPLIASLGKKGVPQYLLAAFMVSSVLINPNLFIFSFALGIPVAFIRLLLCIVAGIVAGILVRVFFARKELFNFEGFEEKRKSRSQSTIVRIFFSDLHRGIVKTVPYFLAGVLLTALFDRCFPKDLMALLFGKNQGLAVLLSASLGVPVYVCGGGTIPLLKEWMTMGMSMGAAIAFMISGPATKLTNLGAVKIILGARNFTLYIAYNLILAVAAGWTVDMIYVLIRR